MPIMPKAGVTLTPEAAEAVKRGGSDKMSDDQMLIAEIIARAPGMSPEDLQQCFINILETYGEEALRAIRSGHVQFEKRNGV